MNVAKSALSTVRKQVFARSLLWMNPTQGPCRRHLLAQHANEPVPCSIVLIGNGKRKVSSGKPLTLRFVVIQSIMAYWSDARGADFKSE